MRLFVSLFVFLMGCASTKPASDAAAAIPKTTCLSTGMIAKMCATGWTDGKKEICKHVFGDLLKEHQDKIEEEYGGPAFRVEDFKKGKR